MDVKSINDRIKKEICYDTIKNLNDENLLNDYKKSTSVKIKIKKLNDILIKNNVDNIKIDNIIMDYLQELIPPGLKGVIRGNKFNYYVKNKLLKMQFLNKERFDILFEKQYPENNTTEIPDWYIHDKESKKTLIGMNQLDFWNGGQQSNRGSKYILSDLCFTKQDNNCKLVCVICNEYKINSDKTKFYKIFNIGFSNNKLCYLNNLENIIKDYFKNIKE
jgi:hypothetical protein